MLVRSCHAQTVSICDTGTAFRIFRLRIYLLTTRLGTIAVLPGFPKPTFVLLRVKRPVSAIQQGGGQQ